MEALVSGLPFQWYRPVRRQLRVILKDVNRERRRAGMVQIRLACIPNKMRVTGVFAETRADSDEAAELSSKTEAA